MTRLALVVPAGAPVDRRRNVESRSDLAALLGERLADAIELQRLCRDAHFFARGPGIESLHKLFIDIYWAGESYARALSARLVQLGGAPSGAIRTLPARPMTGGNSIASMADDDHTERLRGALGAFGVEARVGSRRAAELGDPGSAELFGGLADSVERWLWVVQYELRASV